MSQDWYWREHITHVEVEWKIKHFESLMDDPGHVVHSPAFWMSDTQWYLEIWPSGISLKHKGWIRLGIGKRFSDSKEHELKGSICMLRRDGNPYKTFNLNCSFGSYGVRGNQLAHVSDLKQCSEDVLFPDGALHVRADVKAYIVYEDSFGIPRELPFVVSYPAEFYLQWSVNRLTSLPEKESFEVKSKSFEFASAKWSFSTIPNLKDPSWMRLFLLRESFSVDTQTVAFTVGVTKGDGILFRSLHFEDEFSPEKKTCEFEYFIKSSELLDSEEAVASGSSLTVFCIVRAISAVPNVVEGSAQGSSCQERKESFSALFDSDKGPKSSCEILKENVRSFFLSDRLSDFTIQVQDEKFPAHRAILAARCPFFSTFFENDTQKSTTVMEIKNVDPKTFKEILSFLYSGDVKISPYNVGDLFKAAHKYQLEDLKHECDLYMKNIWYIATGFDQVNVPVPDCYKEMQYNLDHDKGEMIIHFPGEQE